MKISRKKLLSLVLALAMLMSAAQADNHDLDDFFGAPIGCAKCDTPTSGVVVTLRQLSNGRYVDAWDQSAHDFRVVTRPRQNNDTQLWIMTHVAANIVRFQQRSTLRFLDAYEHSGQDFGLVTRQFQGNDTQKWYLRKIGKDIYTIQQVSSRRFVDAHEHDLRDFSLVTRGPQNNRTQFWTIKRRK